MYRKFRSKVAVLQERRNPLPCCNVCEIYMPAGWMLNHRSTARCFKNTEMWIIQRDAEVASWCAEMDFSLKWKEREDTIEGVALLNT